MSKDYYIKIDGENISVSEDVYRAYKRPVWRERKRSQVRANKEISTESLAKQGYELPSYDELIDKIVEDKLMLDMLMTALAELSEDERFLIEQLYFEEKSERAVSEETGIPRKTLSYRKNKLLSKIRKKIERS